MGDAGSACGRSETKRVDYLALACGAAERVERVIDPESGTSAVHLNQAQCRLLAEALSQAVQSAKQDIRGVDGASLPLFDPAFRELCRVAGDCEKLVRDCCNPNWVPSALLLADRRQEFSLRVSELKWCAKAWRTVIQHGLQGGGWLKRFHKPAEMSVGDRGGGTSDDTTRLKVAFEGDLATLQANLRAKVDEMQGSWRELARYVLSRCEMIGRPVGRGGNDLDLSKYELGGLGKKIGDKKVPLGRGGSATVYKIQWFQENFAVKFFRYLPNSLSRGTDGYSFTEFGKDVGAMRKICGHPRSVCFVGVSLLRDDGLPAIIMELLPLDLAQLMREMRKRDGVECVGYGPFPLHVTVDIMLQVAEGVEALHKVHLYHRDIKPHNVLVELVEEQVLRDVGYLRVKLTDYSLTEARSRSFGDRIMGTLIYMAPEIGELRSQGCDGSLVYPSKADTFSYASLCSHILLGELLFGEIRGSHWRKQVAEGLRPELPKALPSLLASLLRRCWDPDPTKRPTFAAICRELRYVKFLMTIGGEDEFRALDDVDEDEAKIVKGLPWVDGRAVRMVRYLGSGGFGSVDECEWEGERVAVKNLPRVKKQDVEKEAALLVRVQHPMHVVRLIGCGFNEEKKGMLVMELMEQDLHHLIRRSMRVGGSEKAGPPFSLCEALEIMWKVAMAMKHIRSCNVLHGDLKTTNILVNVRAGTSCASETHYDVKLADFGLSKYKSGNANFTTRVSEAQYWQAPETSESGKNSWAADVFSFGVVCYEIVSGKRPFEGMEGVEVWRKVRGGERPEIPAYCGSSVGELVNACWATDPKKRPDFSEICTKLEACRSM